MIADAEEFVLADAAWMRGLRVPAEWRLTKVKYLVKSMRAGDPITGDHIEASGNFPVYGANGVRGYTDRKTHEGTYVLIGRQGALCGNVRLVSGAFWASEHAIVASPRPGTDPRWVAALLKVMNLGQYSTSAAQPGIGVSQIAPLPAYVPSLAEQQRIADFLDSETAKIDALIAKQQELVSVLQDRRIAMITSAVTSGIGDNVGLVNSGIDWIGDVPSHWRVDRLKHSIASTQTGIWGDEAQGDENDVLCVRVADFDRPGLGVQPEIPTRRSVKRRDRIPRLLEPGDLLLEKSGGTPANPVGFVAYFDGAGEPAVSSNFITRLRVRQGQNPRYWRYAHAASYATRLTARSVKQTTGIQNLDQTSYFDERFPYPPPDEQDEIAQYLDKKTSDLDGLIGKAVEFIALARERRAALITEAVMGRMDVSTGLAREVA